jgi:hypothetical protein
MPNKTVTILKKGSGTLIIIELEKRDNVLKPLEKMKKVKKIRKSQVQKN